MTTLPESLRKVMEEKADAHDDRAWDTVSAWSSYCQGWADCFAHLAQTTPDDERDAEEYATDPGPCAQKSGETQYQYTKRTYLAACATRVPKAQHEKVLAALREARNTLQWYADTRAEIERKAVLLRSSFKGPDPAMRAIAAIDAILNPPAESGKEDG